MNNDREHYKYIGAALRAAAVPMTMALLRCLSSFAVQFGFIGFQTMALLTSGDPTAPRLHLYLAQSPSTLNPILSTTDEEFALARLVYDSLVAPDASNHLRPRLARIVPSLANGGISADGRTITFKLRSGVYWQDRKPFTSADVAFTFLEINDPKVNVNDRAGYDHILSVTTPDAYTVIVRLREAFSPFVADVGYNYPILPEHAFDSTADFNTSAIGSHPIGTGPYRFKRWEHGSRIEYTANDAYFLGAPKIRSVTVEELPDQNTVSVELRNHELDFAAVDSAEFAELRSGPSVRSATESRSDWVGVALNTTRPILRDVRVRRAISMAIDRATIAAKDTFGTGTPAYADLPALLWMAHEPSNPYGYDPASAGALLDRAGWKRGPSGMREKAGLALSLQGIDYQAKTSMNIDLQIQQMLKDVGIIWTVKYYSPSIYFEPRGSGGPLALGDFDTAAFASSVGPDPENDMFYTCAHREPAGENVARYCSKKMDALQRDSLQTSDVTRRASDIKQIEELAVTDVPDVFLYHTPWRLVWNPLLKRTSANGSDAWYDIEDWTFAAR